MQAYDLDRYAGRMYDEIYWICSDQLQEFDTDFRIPVRDMGAFRAAVKTYLDYAGSLRPDEPSALSETMFRRQLDALSAKGEDIDRLLLWFGSMLEDTPRQGAFNLWTNMLGRWARGHQAMPDSLRSREPYAGIVRSYQADVVGRINDFSDRCDESERRWMGGERSAWDEYLWKAYFEEVYIDPSTFFRLKYRVMLNRQWWRRERGRLDAASAAEFFDGFVSSLPASETFELAIDWEDVVPIDQAFELETVPDFDVVKRA